MCFLDYFLSGFFAHWSETFTGWLFKKWHILHGVTHTENQALNFALEGAQQFSPGKGHFYEENVNLNLNFATAVGAVG